MTQDGPIAESPIASVVIPAHNEAAVIERTLRTLLKGAEPGELDVVVACNGCVDETAERARSVGPSIRVIEIEEASKTAALNAGDEATDVFPRVYLDADVLVNADAVRKTVAMLRDDGTLAASPPVCVDTSGSSWVVRAFYRVWLRRGYHTRQPLGAGFYAVSFQGRQRFGVFPKLIADDEFVRRQFSDAERRSVPDAAFTIRAPRTARDLIKVKTRSRLGRYELRDRFPELFKGDPGEAREKPTLWPPSRWLDQFAYLFIATATVIRARRQFSRLSQYAWERDESSRDASVAH